jgi:regulatory protein
MSSGQIRAKLKEWKVDDSWTEQIMDLLFQQEFVDDQRYASLFVKEKFRLNRWGRVKIAHQLRQRGIEEEIIQNSMLEIDEDTYYRVCVELVKGKSAAIKDRNPYSKKGKILRYVSGKGFETDLIYRILSNEEIG